jgi:hypothetical protein
MREISQIETNTHKTVFFCAPFKFSISLRFYCEFLSAHSLTVVVSSSSEGTFQLRRNAQEIGYDVKHEHS